MLKRILILLSETNSSACARRYAFRLAQRHQASVIGLAGVDLTYLNAPMLGSVGTTALEAGIEQQYRVEANEARRRLRDIFEIECRDHRIEFEWLSFDGDPIETLCLASETCDIVLTGHDTAFRGSIQDELPGTLAKLLQMTPRPVIVCPDDLVASDDILLAYDASLPAMRAVQMVTLLGIGEGRSIHVVSIGPSEERAVRRTAGAAGYLRFHGFEPLPHPIISTGYPADILAREVTDRKIGTLVMGAYGHRGFREFLFGSTTSTLVANSPCALFVYH
jgi:nucleotide-binding universal stress UspA family protein